MFGNIIVGGGGQKDRPLIRNILAVVLLANGIEYKHITTIMDSYQQYGTLRVTGEIMRKLLC